MEMSPQQEASAYRVVLVVDDDEGLRNALLESLCAAGIAASGACDGVDALERIRTGCHPCAILLDMDMPRLDGPGVVAAVRADRTTADVPIITMTAGRAPRAPETQGHLAKPFELGSMLALLFEACRSCGRCDGEGPVGSMFLARRASELRAAAAPQKLG
jgi:CheY-like chemotaxis protein